MLDVVAESKDRLPAGHRVGAYDGVHGLENIADVLGSSTFPRVYLEPILIRRLFEFRLCVGCGERLEEFLNGGRDAVIDFVARCPEGVCFC